MGASLGKNSGSLSKALHVRGPVEGITVLTLENGRVRGTAFLLPLFLEAMSSLFYFVPGRSVFGLLH